MAAVHLQSSAPLQHPPKPRSSGTERLFLRFHQPQGIPSAPGSPRQMPVASRAQHLLWRAFAGGGSCVVSFLARLTYFFYYSENLRSLLSRSFHFPAEEVPRRGGASGQRPLPGMGVCVGGRAGPGRAGPGRLLPPDGGRREMAAGPGPAPGRACRPYIMPLCKRPGPGALLSPARWPARSAPPCRRPPHTQSPAGMGLFFLYRSSCLKTERPVQSSKVTFWPVSRVPS